MAFSSNASSGAMADINVTPLVDVMLVLLIIFMVTMPIQSVPVDVDLPQKSLNPPPQDKDPPDPISLRIDSAGQVFWNDTPTPVSALQTMMRTEVERDPTNQPTLEIDTSDDADYGILAQVLAAAKNAAKLKAWVACASTITGIASGQAAVSHQRSAVMPSENTSNGCQSGTPPDASHKPHHVGHSSSNQPIGRSPRTSSQYWRRRSRQRGSGWGCVG